VGKLIGRLFILDPFKPNSRLSSESDKSKIGKVGNLLKSLFN
jgi:hypothetical protein